MTVGYFDYQFGLSEIIPSGNRNNGQAAQAFYKVVSQALVDVNQSNVFPTKQLVFVFILQFFADQKEYDRRDVDNMCKTMFASLNKKLFEDDSQVKTLLISKQIDPRIPENFVYVGMKIVSKKDDTGMVKVNKKDAILLYQDSKKQRELRN